MTQDKWQPIETAPNNTHVLCAVEFDAPLDWRIKIGSKGENGVWTMFGGSWTPTFWMPLPPPPREKPMTTDTYGIHRSPSTLREVRGDAGPAVAEMLLDRIKELEDDLSYALGALDDWACYGSGADPDMDENLIRARAALNKEQK